MSLTNILVWLIVLGMFGWMGYNYFRIRRAAKIVDNVEFEELIRKGQLVDLRDPNEFHAKHILGARNIPSNQLKVSLAALRWKSQDELRSKLQKLILLEFFSGFLLEKSESHHIQLM